MDALQGSQLGAAKADDFTRSRDCGSNGKRDQRNAGADKHARADAETGTIAHAGARTNAFSHQNATIAPAVEDKTPFDPIMLVFAGVIALVTAGIVVVAVRGKKSRKSEYKKN